MTYQSVCSAAARPTYKKTRDTNARKSKIHPLQSSVITQGEHVVEKVNIDKVFHPFITGAYNKVIEEIMEETGAHINVPPLSVKKTEIVVSGEKKQVALAVAKINTIYEDKKRRTTTIAVEVKKSQHKYVIGPNEENLQKILDKTSVSVEVPPHRSNSQTIILRGEPGRLVQALTEVFIKATSYTVCSVSVPSFFCHLVIGENGQNLDEIMQKMPTVHITFVEGENEITLEGPTKRVEMVKSQIEAIITDLINRTDDEGTVHHPPENKESNLIVMEEDPQVVSQRVCVSVPFTKRFHKNLVGEKGTNIKKIRQETNTTILVPSEFSKSKMIVITGTQANCEDARCRILAIEKDLLEYGGYHLNVPVPQGYHGKIIGWQGVNIKPVCAKYRVRVLFPGKDDSKDEITIAGSEDNARAALEAILGIIEGCDDCTVDEEPEEELVFTNFKMTVPVHRKFHNKIIGHEGANLKPICAEHNVRVLFPEMNGDYKDEINIVGTVYDARAAREAILAILEGPGIDISAIQSPAKAAKKAKLQRLALAEQLVLSNFKLTVLVHREFHSNVIGLEGANLKPLCAEHNVRVLFPEKDDNKDEITIIGSEDNARAAQEAILALAQGIEGVMSEAIPLDSRVYVRVVIPLDSRVYVRVANKCHEIGQKFKVDIRCPKMQYVEVNILTVKGHSERVKEAIDHIINLEEEIMLDVKKTVQIATEYGDAVTKEKEEEEEEEEESPARGNALAAIEEEEESLDPDEYNAPNISSTAVFPTFGAPMAKKTIFSRAWC